MAEGKEWRTAFRCQYKLFKYMVMQCTMTFLKLIDTPLLSSQEDTPNTHLLSAETVPIPEGVEDDWVLCIHQDT